MSDTGIGLAVRVGRYSDQDGIEMSVESYPDDKANYNIDIGSVENDTWVILESHNQNVGAELHLDVDIARELADELHEWADEADTKDTY